MAGKRNPRRLGCESLENRRLMAGDVDVALSGGIDLMITGDFSSNEILVEQIGQEIHITGKNGTTVNGSAKTAVIKSGSFTKEFDDVFIDMNGGNDNVTIRNLNLDYWHHSNLNVDMGSGTDVLWINGATISESVKVETGFEDDIVAINRTDAGSGPLDGNIEVDLAIENVTFNSRSNQLTISNSSATNIRAYTNQGKVLRSSVTADIWLHGNDFRTENEILVFDSVAGDDIYLYGGAGEDFLTVENSTAENIRMYGGDRNDELMVEESTVADDIRLDGGEGDDLMWIKYGQAEDTYFYGRGGNDSISAYQTQIRDLFYASLGDGDDLLFANAASHGRHYFNGGQGRDTIYTPLFSWYIGNQYSFEDEI